MGLKLKNQRDDEIRETIARDKDGLEGFTKRSRSDIRRQQLVERAKLRQSDPVYVDYEVPFSATPYYDYFDNFVLGFKIETDVPASADCFDSVIFTMDDWTYFQNNITEQEVAANPFWAAPLLNATRAVGRNFS